MYYVIVIILALLGIGVVTACVMWDRVRDKLAAWLRHTGLDKTVLMDALVRFDNLAGKVRCRLFATTHNTGTVQIDETVYRMNQIDDPKVLAELRRRGVVERDVLNLVK